MARVDATCALETPHSPLGAGLACIRLTGDIDAALAALCGREARPVHTGQARLRDIGGVDAVLVARWSERAATLSMHGGPFVVRAMLDACARAGVTIDDVASPRDQHPEAADDVEARMLAALAACPSRIAVPLLLDQPRRWRAWDGGSPSPSEVEAHTTALAPLLAPPLVVAVGRTNIGKSTLLNALARRTVAIAGDEPGLTRDHVGAVLDLAGLVVRWADTPGVRDAAEPAEAEAIEAASRLRAQASLLVSCADHSTPFLEVTPAVRTVRVALRADLGQPESPFDLAVSSHTGDGLDVLARSIRDAIVPPEARAWDGPWRFDPALRPRGAAL